MSNRMIPEHVAFGRRVLLRGLLGMAALAGLSTLPLRGTATRHIEHLAALIGSDGTRAIGDRYIAAHPAEASRSTLADLITAADPLRWTGARSDRALRARWHAMIGRDFTHGEIVNVDGWILSRTEARLCALTALA